MKFIELFAGLGGFRLGLGKAGGFECVYTNEFNKYAASIYERNYEKPDTRDIRDVPAGDIPDHDLLTGGFPCQSFSIAGKRGGFEDTRGTLFFEIARILQQKQPRLLLLENVKGLLSHDAGNTFGTILNTLDELGYDLQWQVLNSKDFGVPQNRERVFIVGHLRGTRRPEVFPIGGSNPKTLAEYTQGLSQGYRVYDTDGVSTTLAGEAGGVGAKTGLYGIDLSMKKAKLTTHARALQARYWKGYSHREAETTGVAVAWSKSHRTGKTEADKNRHNYGKVEQRVKVGEFNTLSTGDGCSNQSTSNFVKNGMQIRRLTPVECERLQAFPDNFTKYGADGKEISDTQRYKCLGNAVTTSVIAAIGERLL